MAVRLQNKGLAMVTAALVAYASVFKYLQWGVGTDPGAAANALDDTTGTTESRATGTVSQVTTTVTNDTFQIVGTITAAGARAITEIGAFDSAGTGSPPTGGDMGFYGDFAVLNLNSGDSITFTLKTKFQ